ncbi:MAG: hypothetical protein K0R34_3969 [Herbinix sp.]|jgi:hypothetical protein|nr:hypothetical protein [Herbinix sp.]
MTISRSFTGLDISPSSRFILLIDKNRQIEIDYGSRKIIVYPNTGEEIAAFIIRGCYLTN